ncbi:MAG: hypothetical protein KDM81_09185, partial [Verrucomicrobiae bacterium]|nr:hypothetical protein [Verrucomicrobiae bacterium]
MKFPDLIYLLSFLGGLVTTAASMPFWRAWCRRTGLLDSPGHRKIHHVPIPLAGGFAVLTGLLLPVLAAWVVLQSGMLDPDTVDRLRHGLSRRGGQLAC